MSRLKMRLSGAIALCLAASGCSVYHTEVGGGFAGDRLAAQGAAAGIPLQVDGAVGGVRGAPLATAVASAMPAAVGDAAVHYAPCAPFAECAGDHVVWTFGPAPARPASAYPPELATNVNWFGDYNPGPERIEAKVALFQGSNVVSSASGQVDVSSPNDPAFQAMVSGMSQAIFSAPGWLD